MPDKRKLDASDIATILAALRMFQRKYENLGSQVIINDWGEHFSVARCTKCEGVGYSTNSENYNEHCDSCESTGDIISPAPLGTDDIDTLCEQINCGEVEF